MAEIIYRLDCHLAELIDMIQFQKKNHLDNTILIDICDQSIYFQHLEISQIKSSNNESKNLYQLSEIQIEEKKAIEVVRKSIFVLIEHLMNDPTSKNIVFNEIAFIF